MNKDEKEQLNENIDYSPIILFNHMTYAHVKPYDKHIKITCYYEKGKSKRHLFK